MTDEICVVVNDNICRVDKTDMASVDIATNWYVTSDEIDNAIIWEGSNTITP